MAETFGEADVILRARLDELKRDLDQSERMIAQSTDRVQAAQIRAAQQVQTSNGNGRTTGAAMVDATVSIAEHYAMVLLLRAAWAKLVAVGVTVASTFAMIAGVAALPIFLGDIIRLAKDMPGAFERAKEAIRNFDAKEAFVQGTVSARNFAHEIPLISFALRGLETTISEISELFGGPNFSEEINQLTEATRIAQFEMDELKRGAERAGDAIANMRDRGRAEVRRGQLEGVDGVERVRIEEEHNREDIEQTARDNASAYHKSWQKRTDELRAGLESGAIGQDEFDARKGALDSERVRKLNGIERERQRAMQEAERNAAKRVADAERRQQFGDAGAVDQLASDTAATRMLAAGEAFKAQQIQLEAARLRAVNDLILNGNDDRIAATDEYYDAQAELIRTREEERLQMEAQFQERRAEQERRTLEREREQQEQAELNNLQTNERLRSQILQERMKQAGDQVAAQQEAIRQRFQEQMDRMRVTNNIEGAKLTNRLFQMEMKAAEAQEIGMRAGAGARDVSRDRITEGAGITDKGERQRDRMLRTLDRIADNTADDGDEFS